MKRFILLGALLALLQLLGCTWSTSGGTTDTGNARMAAVIYTTSGSRAAGAVVTACPAGYFTSLNASDSAGTSGKKLRTVTDDTGYFSFPDIGDGIWYIEVNDLVSSAVRVEVTIDSTHDELFLDTILAPYAVLTGNAGRVSDSQVVRYFVIDGLDRRIPVTADGVFLADNLPQGTYHCRIVAESGSWTVRDFDSVTVVSDSTVFLKDTAKDTIPEEIIDTTVIVLNTSVSGAEVTGMVTDFPVVIRLDSSSVDFSEAGKNGTNIRFLNRSGVQLPFTVELWDTVGSKAILWMLADTVRGNDSTQSIFLVCSDSTGENVGTSAGSSFDTSLGNLACYHFAGTLNDASGNLAAGVDSGTADTSSGIIGHARAFNGKGDFFTVGQLPDRQNGTISFWFRPNVTVNGATGTTQGIWGKKVTDSIDYTISLQGSDFWAGTGSAGALITKQENIDTGYYLSSSRKTYEKGVWYHAVWCWNEGGDSLYVNGTLEASVAASVPVGTSGREEIGRSFYDDSNISSGGPLYFHGTLDEFRIDRICRSPSWVKLSYMNQRSDDRLVVMKKAGKKVYPLRKKIGE